MVKRAVAIISNKNANRFSLSIFEKNHRMNREYLEDLLSQAQQKSFPYTEPKWDEIKVKAAEAIRYLFSDGGMTAVKLEHLSFFWTSPSSTSTNRSTNFEQSKAFLISTLEARIEILKLEEEKKKNQAAISDSTQERVVLKQISDLKAFSNSQTEQINLLKKENDLNNETIISLQAENADLNRQINDFPAALKQASRIKNLKSLTLWLTIVGIAIAAMAIMYDLGKDNGIKQYDIEKRSLDDENRMLKKTLDDKDKTIDSIRSIIKESQNQAE